MIKSELIIRLGNKMRHLSDQDMENGVNGILEHISYALSCGQRVEVRGFGSFTLHYRAPRKAHNPKTGEKVITDPKYIPHFKAGKEFRERVNEVFLRQQADQAGSQNQC